MKRLVPALAALLLPTACSSLWPPPGFCPVPTSPLAARSVTQVSGKLRAPIGLLDPTQKDDREIPVANGNLALADAQGRPYPGIHAQSGKDGSYTIGRAIADYTYEVVARVKRADGRTVTLRGLTRAGQATSGADVNAATTALTLSLTDGLTGGLGAYDADKYKQAVAKVYEHMTADGMPDLADNAATRAKLAGWLAADPALKQLFDGLRAQLAQPSGSTDALLAQMAQLDGQPTPQPASSTSATPTPLPAGSALPSPEPSPSPLDHSPGYQDGPLSQAQFNGLAGIAADERGLVYAADANNHRIRLIDLRDPANTSVTTIAGNGKPGSNDGDGTGANATAQLNDPRDVALDGRGRLFIAENGGHRIRMIDLNKPNFPVSTISGALEGHQDGTSDASFDHPVAIAADPKSGMLYVAESFGQVLRVIDPNQAGHPVGTLAGVHRLSGRLDGSAAAARFNSPEGLAFGPDGHLYVADTRNNLIRRVKLETPIRASAVETVAGQTEAAAGSNNEVAGLVNGPAGTARFSGPVGLAFDAKGDLLVADTLNKCIRKVTLSANPVLVETAAGPDMIDLEGKPVTLSFPAHLTFDGRNTSYMADLRLGLLVRLP